MIGRGYTVIIAVVALTAALFAIQMFTQCRECGQVIDKWVEIVMYVIGGIGLKELGKVGVAVAKKKNGE